MTSTAKALLTLGSVGAFMFLATAAMDIYAGYIRPEAFPDAGWAPPYVHSLLMTLASVFGASATIAWFIHRRNENDQVYKLAYRQGQRDLLSVLTTEEAEPVLLHQRRAHGGHHSGRS